MALSATAVAFAVGLTIDYSRMTRAQKALQNVVDIAALAAVQENSLDKANTVFTAYASSYFGDETVLEFYEPRIDSFVGDHLVAIATGQVRLTFGGILGYQTMPVSVRSEVARTNGYQELLFAIDLSSSLGMAATEEDRRKLGEISYPYTRTAWYGEALPQGCAFACHLREGWEPAGKTMHDIARENNILLREDELIRQFGGLVDLLLSQSDPHVAAGKRKVSVMAFSNTTDDLIIRSSSASAVKATLDDFPSNRRYETHYWNAFNRIGQLLGNQGTGSADSPSKMVILITDGIESRDAFYAQRAIDESLCANLKEKGFEIAVVELKYPVIQDNYLYRDTVKPVEDQISPAMQRCASPGWYFQAANNTEIPGKFNELREKFGISNVRLMR